MTATPTARALLSAPRTGRSSVERAFFAGLRLPNGTFKTTWPDRLDDLNALVLEHLPPSRPLRVKDVAVSSGVSSLEWAQALDAAAVPFAMTACDLLVEARIVELPAGLAVLTDTTGRPLQYDLRGRAVRPDQLEGRARLRYGVPAAIAARLARPRDGRPFRLVLEALAARDDVIVREEDLLAPPGGGERWDVVRAANILNVDYFPASKLRDALRGLWKSLSPGGLLVVCRTADEGTNHASILSAEGVLARLGDGSEVEDLALETAH